jgi:hypothetical protein
LLQVVATVFGCGRFLVCGNDADGKKRMTMPRIASECVIFFERSKCII